MASYVYLGGQRIRVDPTQAIGKGGEADIFDIGGGKALKVFKPPDHPDYHGFHQEQQAARERIEIHQTKLREFPKKLPSRIIVPEGLVTNQSGDRIVGYTMRLLSGAEVLMRYGERAFRQAGVSNEMVSEIFRDLHKTVYETHKAGVIIGDFNDLNVLVIGDEAYIVDADSFQFGKYPCRLFTARFVDPLLCDPRARGPMLIKPHGSDSDWYAYSVMLMQSLLFVDPYGGVYVPKNPRQRIPHTMRPLRRITVFHPEVRYPKPAVHFSVLPDELLQFFHEIFEKDKRAEFPLKLLEEIRWTTCSNCGTQHARSVCPVCAQVAEAAIREVTVVKGKVIATRIFKTRGLIVFAAYQEGKILFLYHENGQYKREDGSLVAQGSLDPQMRYRIRGPETLMGKDNRLVTFQPGKQASSMPVDRVGLLPIFDANSKSRYWLANGQLRRDGKWGESEVIGDVLSGQTQFWVGPKFGFGFYRAGNLSVAFVFDAAKTGIRDDIKLPPIRGQLIDSTCFFSQDRCWFLISTREGGKTINQCFVILPDGKIEAQAQAEIDDGSWLSGSLRGKCAIGNSLLVATDEGIVRVDVDHGQIVLSRKFPDTEPFVDEETHLFPAEGGVYAVSNKEVTLLKIG